VARFESSRPGVKRDAGWGRIVNVSTPQHGSRGQAGLRCQSRVQGSWAQPSARSFRHRKRDAFPAIETRSDIATTNAWRFLNGLKAAS
jgi:hypothetical protein